MSHSEDRFTVFCHRAIFVACHNGTPPPHSPRKATQKMKTQSKPILKFQFEQQSSTYNCHAIHFVACTIHIASDTNATWNEQRQTLNWIYRNNKRKKWTHEWKYWKKKVNETLHSAAHVAVGLYILCNIILLFILSHFMCAFWCVMVLEHHVTKIIWTVNVYMYIMFTRGFNVFPIIFKSFSLMPIRISENGLSSFHSIGHRTLKLDSFFSRMFAIIVLCLGPGLYFVLIKATWHNISPVFGLFCSSLQMLFTAIVFEIMRHTFTFHVWRWSIHKISNQHWHVF